MSSSAQKEIAKILRRLRRMDGVDVSIGSSTHYRVRGPRGTVSVSLSPSDVNAPRQVRRDLKKIGVKL